MGALLRPHRHGLHSGAVCSTPHQHLVRAAHEQVVLKFPVEVTAAHAELFLLPLVMRLVNDPAPKCRAAVAAALRILLNTLPAPQHDTFASYCRQVR